MHNSEKKIIFHIDVNSAYLSWTAVDRLQRGESLDIRAIPAVIGGDANSRHGIVLAKSIKCKPFKITTGEPLFQAKLKCKDIQVFPPNYELYMKCSNAMVEILNEYSPLIQRYSVDECFLDGSHFGEDYLKKANEIKNRIENELGFTVNIGISHNKLLAKMASDLEKPNKIHTLFPHEIEKKMWPLDIGDLFMAGRSSTRKLRAIGIETIGDLAKYDLGILKRILKSHGDLLYKYANGIDNSPVRNSRYVDIKGIGNSTTISHDVDSREEALKILLALTENCSMRLRKNKSICKVVTVHIKNSSFMTHSHQRTMYNYTDSTNEIYEVVKKLFNEMWHGDKIRHLGIRLSTLCSNEYYQSSLFDSNKTDKQRALDSTIDKIREKYNSKAVVRSTFLHSGVKPIIGGIVEEDYPMMSSLL